MSGTVDTRTVEMRFDNKNFESNVKQSMSTLDKLKRALKLDGASKGLADIERSSKKLKFKDLDDSVGKVGKSFSALETVATGVLLRIGMKAADAGAKIVKSLSIDQAVSGWNKYAEKTTAVQTIMANLKDDTSKFTDELSKMEYVNRYLERLMWFSDETSYNFTDMTGNVGKFIANGQDLEESVKAMQGIATWAAMSGQNAQTASRAMYQISQAMGVGSMKVKDWMSIENANMATAQFKELAIAVGEAQGKIKKGAVTVESFRESLGSKDTNGWFDKSVMMEVFETYGAAADRIREYAAAHDLDTSTAIEELEALDSKFAESLGFKAFRAAQEAKTFSEVVAATADAASTKWTKFFENIFGNYLEAKKLWTDLSEDLYTIFIEPMNTLNDIMSTWKRGFFENGPASAIQKAFEKGTLDILDGSGFHYITKEAADLAVSLDSSVYSIKTMENGTKRLIRTIKHEDGTVERFYKTIFQPEKGLLSGRDALLGGFKNIMQIFFTGYEDKEGNEVLSVLQTIKNAFKDTFFPKEDNFSIAKYLWKLTKRFRDFTEKIKPSEETLGKIKNSFKGLFTVFKIAGKFIKAVVKPFKDIFKTLFGGNVSKGILNLADGMATWLQKLEQFLDKNGKFKAISDSITNGLNTISKALTGLSLSDLIAKVRKDVTDFFKNVDFEKVFSSIGGWLKKINLKNIFTTIVGVIRSNINFFKKVVSEIKAVETEELPEKLTPIQNFWIGLKEIFKGVKAVIPIIFNAFGKVAQFISNAISGLSNSKKLDGELTPLQNFWIGLKEILKGVKSVLGLLSGPFRKVATFIGEFLSGISKQIIKHDKVTRAIHRSVSNSNTAFTEVRNLITGIVNFFGSIGLVLGKAATGIGKVFTAIAMVIKRFVENNDAETILKTLLAGGIFVALITLAIRIKWMVDAVNSIIEPIGEMLDELRLTMKFNRFTKLMFGIAAMVVAITAAIGIIAKVVKDVGWGTVLGITAILLVFTAIPILLAAFAKKMDKDAPAIYKVLPIIAGFMTTLVVFLLLIAQAFKKFAAIEFNNASVETIALVFAGFTAIMLLTAYTINTFIGQKISVKALASMSGFMIAVSAALIVLSHAFKKFAKIKFDNTSVGAISLIFTSFIAIMLLVVYTINTFIASKINVKALALMSGFMIAVSAALIVLSHAFQKFAKIKFDSTNVGIISAIFAGFILLVTGIATLSGLLLKSGGAIAGVAVMAGFMITAAVSLGIVATAFSKLGSDISPSQMAAALAIMISFGAIVAVLAAVGSVLAGTGVGLAGMALIAVIITAIGFACLGAGAGIALFVNSVSNLINTFMALMEAVTKYGPSFISSIDAIINAALDSIINAGEKMKTAAVTTLTSIANAIIEAAPVISLALTMLLIYLMDNVNQTINQSLPILVKTFTDPIPVIIYAIADDIRAKAPILADAFRSVCEACIEVVLAGLAGALEPIPVIGKGLAEGVMGWIPGLRKAFEIVDEEGDSVLAKWEDMNTELKKSGKSTSDTFKGLFDEIKEMWNSEGLVPSLFGEGNDLSSLLGLDGVDLGSLMSGQMKGVSEAVKKETPEVQAALKKAFDAGELDTPTSAASMKYGYISNAGAKKMVESNPAVYAMRTLEDGTAQLTATVKDSSGKMKTYWKNIYDVDLLSGLEGAEEAATKVNNLVDTLDGTHQKATKPAVVEKTEQMVSDTKQAIDGLKSSMFPSGADAIQLFVDGMESKKPLVRDTATSIAEIVHSILGFSEPEKGPLSDFHTYAPDMIKLWCKGVKDNLHLITTSSDGLGNRINSGFSTALDYVSGLIDDGMTDELTIRPIMDLSEIQNGVQLLDSMLSGSNDYLLHGTANLTSSAAYGMRSLNSNKIEPAQQVTEGNSTFNNTFNITSNDPDAVANKVSKILQHQVNRKQAVWAK